MKTIEQAILEPGITRAGTHADLEIRFDPFPNWYGYFKGLDCPLCGNGIDWEWVGTLPGITTPEFIQQSGTYPVVTGGTLKTWGHRHIIIQCGGCNATLFAHNFD